MKKVVLELSEETFAWLEILVVGMASEETEKTGELSKRMDEITSKDDTFSKGVVELLTSIADSLSTGVKRPGCWERGVLESLTGWQGTYKPGTFADCIKEDAKQRKFKVDILG